MTHPRITQGAAALTAIALGNSRGSACSDNVSDFPTGRSAAALTQAPDIHGAIAAQRHHTDALMRIPGVVGTAVALVKGRAAVRIFVERADVRGLPSQLDGRSEEHTSELQSPCNLVCRLLLEKKKTTERYYTGIA